LFPRVVATFAALVLASAAGAADEPKAPVQPAPPSAAEKFRALRQEVEKARADIIETHRREKQAANQQALLARYFAAPTAVAGRMLDLAKSDPKDPAAVEALLYVVTEAPGTPEAMTAADLLVKDHPRDTRTIAGQVPRLAQAPSPAGEKVLRGLLARAGGPEEGWIMFALARQLKAQAESTRELQGAGPADVQRLSARLGDGVVAALRTADPDKIEDEATKLFDAVIGTYGEVRDGRGPLAAQAKAELYEMKNLAIGKPAPEIDGEDLEGARFKLSDYRGKVVLLNFWGYWRSNCRAMFPFERALVKRLDGKPFAIVGVESDTDREKMKEEAEEEKMTWKSFWDGGKDGPIAAAWNVRSWPTVYIIDAQGVIRHKYGDNPGERKLDAEIDELIQKAKAK
jgi:peroxiredoxin